MIKSGFMKKWMSIMLACAFLAAYAIPMNIPYVQAESGTAVLLDESFNAGTHNQPDSDVYRFAVDFNSYGNNVRPDADFDNITEMGPASMRVQPFPSLDNRSLHIKDDTNPGHATVRLTKNFTPNPAKTTVEWKFYNEYGTDKNGLLYFDIKGNDASDNLKSAMRIGVRNNTGQLVYVNQSGTVTPVADVQPRTWYTVTVIGDAAGNTFDLYVNGMKLLANQPFENQVQDLRQLFLNTGYTSSFSTSLYINYLLIEGREVIPQQAVLETVNAILDKTQLRRNETAPISLQLLNHDGTGHIGPYEVHYSSSDESVLNVDAQGTITGMELGTATVTVEVAANGVTVYEEIPIQVIPNDSAAVAQIYVDGQVLENFDPNTFVYTLRVGDTESPVPVITAEAAPTSYTIIHVEQAPAVPGQTKIHASSEDGTHNLVYIFNIIPEGVSSNADLHSLLIDGVSIPGFHKDLLEYTVYYDEQFPTVSAVKSDEQAQLSTYFENDQRNEAQLTVMRVTAQDGLNYKAYIVKLVKANRLYVSADGSDSWSGRFSSPVMAGADGPFQTLEKARDTVRELKQGGMNGDIIVYIGGGDYILEQPLTFNEADSGEDGFRVIYKGNPEEAAVITGGREITGWQHHEGNIYKAYAGTEERIGILSENHVLATVARFPNEGYNGVAQSVPGALRTQFIFDEGEIPSVTDPRNQGMQVFMWNGAHRNWYSYVRDVAAIDYDTNTLSLTSDMAVNMERTTRYFVQNTYELLDAPGEFYHDLRDGYLYYWPMGDTILQSDIYAGRHSEVVAFAGSSSADEGVVRDITLEGVAIADSKASLVSFSNAENIEVKYSKLYNSGSSGITMRNRAVNNLIYGNEIYNIGHNGIDIQGAGASTLLKNQNSTHSNRIENNYIHHTGVVTKYGAGVYLYSTGSNEITHNRIHYTPRYSISLKFPRYGTLLDKQVDGVTVNLDPDSEYYVGNFIQTRDNLIAFNDVSFGNYDSSDTGLIESYGTRGNIIHNNIVRDSYINDSFGFAIYLDDGSDDFTVTNNVIYNTQMEGYGDGSLYAPLVLKGKNNRAANNIIADNDAFRGNIFFQQNTDYESNRDIELERNILSGNGESLYFFVNWTDSNPLRYAEPGDRLKRSEFNVFYNPDSRYSFYTVPGIRGFADWQQLLNRRYDQHSLIADPLFMDRDNQDYRLQYNSPAYALGFQDIDFASVGLKPDFPFAASGESIDKVYLTSNKSGNRTLLDLELLEEEQLQLVARTQSGYIADTAHAQVSYTSENPAVASVDEIGKVTGIGPGLTTVTVTVAAEGVLRSTRLYVSVGRGFDQLTLQSGVEQLAVGQSTSTLYYGNTIDGAFVDLRQPDEVTFATSNANVAAVSSDGAITGVGPGIAEITATVAKNGVARSGSVVVEVFDNPLSQITLNTKWMMEVGETRQSSLTAKLDDGSNADLSHAAIQYASSDAAILDIDGNGFITAIAPGTVHLLTSIQLDGVEKTHIQKVVVIDPDPELNGYSLVNFGNVQSTAAYDPAKDEYTIISTANGSGTVAPAQDAFASIIREVSLPEGTESFSVKAKVNYIEQQNHQQITAGIFLKEGYEDGARMINLRTQVDGGTRMNYRQAENETAAQSSTHWIQYPIELELVKSGNFIYAYYQMEGGEKHHFQTIEFGLGNEFIVGIFAFNPMSPGVPTEFRISGLVLTPDLPDQGTP